MGKQKAEKQVTEGRMFRNAVKKKKGCKRLVENQSS